MTLLSTQSSTINGFPGIVQNGFLGISDSPGFFTGAGAASMIHIDGGNSIGTQYQGFRPWMRYGTLITSNDDLMYMGHRSDSTLNKTDAVISWSDNGSNSQFGPDNLRFIFTGETNYGGTSTSHTESGQEVMRITAAPAANMGIGNFSSNGLDEQPTERVDIDGTARLRNTPNNSPNALITGVVQSINPQAGDYILNYLEFPGDDSQFLAGDGTWQPVNSSTCDAPISDWNSVNGGTDMAMGYAGACVEGNVTIGANGSLCKLFVGDVLQSNESFTNLVISNGNITNFNNSFTAMANGAMSRATAINGEAWATQGGVDLNDPTESIGVRGFASASMCFANTIGVWGEAVANPTCAGALAGYFVGNVHVTGLLTGPSDYNLKRNITDVDNPLELLRDLRLRNYEFRTDEFPYMQLPEGSHYGLIAQEL